MAEMELNELISEYLTAQGFLRTVATFNTEAETRTKSLSTTHFSEPQGNVRTQFLEMFEYGECQAFFKLWNNHIPLQIRTDNVLCQQLECHISAYFAVYPLRTGVGDKGKTMQEFRTYLEDHGPIISLNQELASYFALPYIPDPSKHPSFRHLFLKPWTEEVQSRLVQLLKEVLPSVPPTSCPGPTLLSLYIQSKNRVKAELQDDCLRKLGEVQVAYHTLCGITMELVGALEASVAGQQINPEFISGVCSRLLKGKACPTAPTPGPTPRPSTSTLRASLLSLSQSVGGPGGAGRAEEDYPLLDFVEVKKILHSGTSSQQTLLLQALRWRLTHSPLAQRERVIESYINNNLLQECEGSSSAFCLLSSMTSQHVSVREQVARLINAFSSLFSGRSYVARSPFITLALLDLLYGEGRMDTSTRRNALGAIQKLSLRRTVSRLMIKQGIVRWVVEDVLAEQNSLSYYTLRYAIALLMNISLRALGRASCAMHAQPLLKALGGMLEHKAEEVSEYVNGTLYSLLSLPVLRQVSKEMGLEEVLREALSRSASKERREQFQWILQQLLSQQPSDETADSGDEDQETDEDNEADPDVIEGDEGEVVLHDEVPRGETLLIKDYILDASVGSNDAAAHLSEAATKPALSTDANDILNRLSFGSLPATSRVQSSMAIHGRHVCRPVTPQSYRSHSCAEVNTPVQKWPENTVQSSRIIEGHPLEQQPFLSSPPPMALSMQASSAD